jgi:hypothetical protein
MPKERDDHGFLHFAGDFHALEYIAPCKKQGLFFFLFRLHSGERMVFYGV